ncbi:dienelactone hydrolase family protein [Ensifer aridi]|jgi:dienelactone hydrolase|uniref:dienelactone hydrolase family protein n=1 Tax=Ensifer aridi TaxID=1708715 RepID=UPI001FCCD470|nr:dienelactone hydrolase family protein [Ensifer aridi]
MSAHAASSQQFTVPTPAGRVLVESFGNCANATCPAVVILSGSKGFGAPVYDEIGQTLRAAGLNAYLVHVLSAADLDAIATAGNARARIAYYAQRLPDWTSAIQGVSAYLESQPHHGGKVGILGISLGAQIASAASAGRSDIDALVLVDGGFPNGYSQPVRSLPPLLLIWGSADRTFPLSIGRELQRTAQQLGGLVTLDVYEGGAHDFFLRSGTRNTGAAHQSAADFLMSHLSR